MTENINYMNDKIIFNIRKILKSFRATSGPHVPTPTLTTTDMALVQYNIL